MMLDVLPLYKPFFFICQKFFFPKLQIISVFSPTSANWFFPAFSLPSLMWSLSPFSLHEFYHKILIFSQPSHQLHSSFFFFPVLILIILSIFSLTSLPLSTTSSFAETWVEKELRQQWEWELSVGDNWPQQVPPGKYCAIRVRCMEGKQILDILKIFSCLMTLPMFFYSFPWLFNWKKGAW